MTAINGEERRVSADFTVKDLVEELTGHQVGADGKSLDGSSLGIAVAGDEAVVPRSQWAITAVSSFKAVDVVTAVQGG